MNSCLSTDLILQRIISKLKLNEKFGVQGVCCKWKTIAIQCLREHQSIVITQLPLRTFIQSCFQHPVSSDNLIWGEQTDTEFWEKTLPLLSGVKYVYLDVRTHDGFEVLWSNYSHILRLLMNTCGKLLECLCIPRYRELEGDTFLMNHSLPSLKHLLLRKTSDKVTRNILNACPNLEHLRSSTTFTDWKVLPKGFKILEAYSDYLEGLIGLLSSPAVETLEVVDGMTVTSEICYKPYRLTRLKELSTCIEFETSKCLLHLARIVSYAPVLNELSLEILTTEDIESDSWIKLLSQCQTVSKLTVQLDQLEEPKTKVSSWQDHFARIIVSKMKNLTHLDIGFHLSSQGLRSIAQLENLQYFYHVVHTENMSYESVFDTDALVYYLSEALSKKLTSYRIFIPTAESYGEYLILKESFLDFTDKIQQQYFVRFDVCQDDRHFDTEIPHPEKIPGMIYVTSIYLSEWDLLRPEMCFDDKEGEGEEESDNLLFSLMATQSYVHDIFVESGQK